jgi:hypothetical protein
VPRARRALAHLLLAVVPTFLVLGALEGAARLAFRARCGWSYAEEHAFVPHPELVYANNPRYQAWRRRRRDRFEGFFIPPLDDHSPAQRLMVLGGSTSAAMPDGSDWPSQVQGLIVDQPVRIVNLAVEGYGIGQERWLHEHYRERVAPEAVVLFSGWNYRGARSSQVAFKPFTSWTAQDPWPRRLSGWLLGRSAAYGMAFSAWHKRHLGDPCGPDQPYPELLEWERETREAIAAMASRDRLLVVLYPGLAMREDVRPFLGGRLRCEAARFELHRQAYEQRIAVLERAARDAGAEVLDVRPGYLALPPQLHAQLFKDECHQVPEGNAYLARLLLEELVARGALPRDASRGTPPQPQL